MRHDVHTRDIKLKLIVVRVAKVLYQVLRAGNVAREPVLFVTLRVGREIL